MFAVCSRLLLASVGPKDKMAIRCVWTLRTTLLSLIVYLLSVSYHACWCPSLFWYCMDNNMVATTQNVLLLQNSISYHLCLPTLPDSLYSPSSIHSPPSLSFSHIHQLLTVLLPSSPHTLFTCWNISVSILNLPAHPFQSPISSFKLTILSKTLFTAKALFTYYSFNRPSSIQEGTTTFP